MYQSYYKLTGKPFRLSPDPAFFFPSRGHKRALAYLRYGLNQDEGFVVITGAPGTGKTTLAKILLQEMDAGVVVAHLTTTQLEADDMLRMVAASFGLRYEGLDKAGLLKSLENFLLARSRERKRALLVIDEAQNLPPRSLEELRMLSNLQIGDKALLQIFLLGQEQFRHMLDNPSLEQLRQRVIANYHLSPLGADECQRYIESRLEHVGWNGDPHFAEIAHERIHEFTDGIPRRINMLCDRILLYGCMEETHAVTGEVVGLVKQEMDDEISGKSVDSSSDGDFQGPSEPVKIAEPAAKYQQQKTSKPVASSPPLNVSESGNTGYMAQSSASFDDMDADEEYEELDIDYAMFEDKEDDSPSKDYDVAQEETLIKPENVVEEPSSMFEAGLVDAQVKEKLRQEKEKLPTVSELEEKLEKKDQQRAVSTTKAKSEQEQESSSNGKQVMGNTVQKPKPEETDSDEGDSAKPSEISERDLFRVIPGGKSSPKFPGTGAGNRPGIAASADKSEPSSEDVRLRRILRLVLAFHRSPSRFPGLDTPAQPLPEGITELLELAISDDQVLNQVSPAAVMGISPVMLRAAVRFFVRRALFTPEGDSYRTLGLQPDASLAQIEKHYDLLMRLLRQDKQRGSVDSVERVGQAYEALSRGENSTTSVTTVDKPQDHDSIDESKEKDLKKPTESQELMIDFDEMEKNPPKPGPSTFVAKPNERFNPTTGGLSRKTVRYASQLAVLGFGALVIILGLYIVQLEPGGSSEQKQVTTNGTADNAGSQLVQERRRGLQFSDGSTSEAIRSTTENTLSDNNKTDAKEGLLSQKAQERKAEIEALRNELLAARGEETQPASESASLSSKFDFDPTEVSAPGESDEKKPESDITTTQIAATEALPSNKTPNAVTQQDAKQVDSKPVKPEPVATQRSSKPSNRFEGKDIEIVDKQPSKPKTSFSSIAARTAAPKVQQRAPRRITQPRPVTPKPPKPSTQLASASSPANAVKQNANVSINETEIFNLIDSFVASYDTGNVNKVMSLFASDARTNNRTNAKGIKSDYTDLFKSTTKRKMSISAMNWTVENDYARGVGDYKAQINPVGTQGSQTFSGNVTIQLQKNQKGLKITRFYFSNQSVSTGPRMEESKPAQVAKPAPAVAAVKPASKQIAPHQLKITSKDLQALVSGFAQTYANGDLNGLMSLFHDSAKTNDQSTKAGIRKDYADLFQGTSARQMLIKNMKWTIKNNRATGEGPFEVKVQAKNSKNVTTVKGKIKISAVKDAKGSLITEMVHTVQ